MFTITHLLATVLTAGTLTYGVISTDIVGMANQAMAKTDAIAALTETQHVQIANVLFENDHGRKATGLAELAQDGKYLDLKTRDEQRAKINQAADISTTATPSGWAVTEDGVWLSKESSAAQCAGLAELQVLDASRICQVNVAGDYVLYVRRV